MRRRIRSLVIAASVAAACACSRRETPAARTTAPATPPSPPPRPSNPRTSRRARNAPPGGRSPVLWIGLDGLDWELLDRLAAEGRMPNWKRLTAEGWTANLESEYPLISPILWTTAATGVGPDVHRVLDFQETDPKTGTEESRSPGFSRAVPAVWNAASAAGRKVGVVGWWATHPGGGSPGLLHQRPREPDPLRRPAARRRRLPGGARVGARAGDLARRQGSGRRPRALPRRAVVGDRGGASRAAPAWRIRSSRCRGSCPRRA